MSSELTAPRIDQGVYPWPMADRIKLSKQLEQRLQRFADAARELPEDWAKRADDQLRQDWDRRKAAVMLERIDATYRSATPRHAKTQDWLKAFRKGDPYNLVIAGHTGVGKTWEAASVAVELLTKDYTPVTMISAPELMDTLRPNADGNVDIGQYQVTPVLIIDDLGAEKVTEWTIEQLYLLTNYRAAKRLPMIITTNLGRDQLQQHVGERVWRRVTDGASLLVITEKPQAAQRTFDRD